MFRVVTIAREDTSGSIGRTLHQIAHRFRIEEILFLVITVGPWIVLVWLLWPHR